MKVKIFILPQVLPTGIRVFISDLELSQFWSLGGAWRRSTSRMDFFSVFRWQFSSITPMIFEFCTTFTLQICRNVRGLLLGCDRVYITSSDVTRYIVFLLMVYCMTCAVRVKSFDSCHDFHASKLEPEIVFVAKWWCGRHLTLVNR